MTTNPGFRARGQRRRSGLMIALLWAISLLIIGGRAPAAAALDVLPTDTILANDDVSTAVPVVGSLPFTQTGSTVSAGRSATDPHISGYDTNTVWYRYTPTTTGYLQANTFGSDYDTTLGVYTMNNGVPTEIASNDDATGGGSQSRVDFLAVAGTTYWFMAASYSEGGGFLEFTVQPGQPPAAIQLVIAPNGSYNNRTGAATITVRFTADIPVYVRGCEFSLAQRGNAARFSFPVNARLMGRDWVLTFQDTAGRGFGNGKAILTATVYYTDPLYGYQTASVDQQIVLKKEK
jgi:hypothetical protein